MRHLTKSVSSPGGAMLPPSASASARARELTGAPLISYAVSHFSGRQQRQPRPGPPLRPPSSYYAGQHLYHNNTSTGQHRGRDRGQAYVQDFYQNPGFGHGDDTGPGGLQGQTEHRHQKLTSSKSFDNLSDTISVTSDESADHFKPRIIKPRRRRKKEKRRVSCEVGGDTGEQLASTQLDRGAWLPTGLLSAEDTESAGDSGREEERGCGSSSTDTEQRPGRVGGHRKLAATLSVPAYTHPATLAYGLSEHSSSSSVGSDYYSQGSQVSPGSSEEEDHQPTSCSYFRSPQLDTKLSRPTERARLRKTNSWAYPGSGAHASTQAGAFSLFSPGTSTDLLSGIRKHLSKIDLNEPEELGK